MDHDEALRERQIQAARQRAAMHSQDAIEAFLEDLRQLCEAHDVVLLGTCDSEGIFGEITIGRLGNAEAISWKIDTPYKLHKGSYDFANWEIHGYFPRLPDRREVTENA